VIRKNILAILSSFLFLFYIFTGITLPYVGQNAYNYIIYSLIAHNYNQFGYLQTKFASVISVARELPENPAYFIHHPPLLSLVESWFLRFLGEDFWVGRLSVILFAVGTFVLAHLIEKQLTKKYSYVTIGVMAIIPASTLFGKMIGQEPLVLFFIMLAVYSSLRFLTSYDVRCFYIALLAVFLGTLSDWPMTYFSVFLLLLYYHNKKLRIGLLLPVVSSITALLLALWIAWIRSGFWDLLNAVELRSFAGLTDIPYWPLMWVGATALRILIYFNPFVVLLSFWGIFFIYKRYKREKLKTRDIVVIIFFLFGFFHITLYTEASFTHPYLLYYLVPFFTFSASSCLVKLLTMRRMLFLSLFTLFSLFYLFLLQDVKKAQVESNIWRYELAKSASNYLNRYETIVYNKHYAIDPDIWMYPLLIPHVVQDERNSKEFLSHYSHYVYSCMHSCVTYKGDVNTLKLHYQYLRLFSKEAEVYVFFLKKPQNNRNHPRALSETFVETPQVNTPAITSTYRFLRDVLHAPQL
jgi:hypothetical protein